MTEVKALHGFTRNDVLDDELIQKSRCKVTIRFKPMWKLLIDRSMIKEVLRVATGLSDAIIAKMGGTATS